MLGLLLAGCAATEAQRAAHSGYWDAEIDPRTYEVGYRCNSETPHEDVATYVLYRAAEITRQAGYDHFVVIEEDSEARPFTLQSPRMVTLTATTAAGPGMTNRPKHAVHATIRLYKGEKPPGAYTAVDVLATLGPLVERHAEATRAD